MTDRHFSDKNRKIPQSKPISHFFNMIAGILIASLWVSPIMVFIPIKGYFYIMNIKGTFYLKPTRGVIWTC